MFQFLTRFAEEADVQKLSEAQASQAVSRFLTGPVQEQFDANHGEYPKGGWTAWPEIVDGLRRNYATPNNIRKAVQIYRILLTGTSETELQFAARANRAAHRVGNTFSVEDKMTEFIYGLIPTI